MPPSKNEYIRTFEDVTGILHHASIDSDTLEKPVQVLYFKNKLTPFVLLELDATLSQSISSGETIKFLGKAKDKLVLCTKSATYDVKSAQTSNSMLVVSNLILDNELNNKDLLLRKDICNVHHSYLELRKIKGNISMVRVLLNKNVYKGPELEPDSYNLNNAFFTTNDLIEEIQMSEVELLEVLSDLDALQVEGYWRLLAFDYHFRALSFLINLIDENSWSLSSIPMGETLRVLSELLPANIANHIFSVYCIATGAIEDDEQLFELDQKKVCRFLAAALLSHADKFNLDDFMVAWQQGVPEGMEIHLSMIKDFIIIEGNTDSSKSVSYFPEYDLSNNILERFKQLFKAKSSWTYQEIKPFLDKLSTEKQDVKAILTKYTRTSLKENEIYYFAKYGK